MIKEKTDIVLFETKDKSVSLPVETKDETVWLSVSQMAILFDREESNIRRHVLNVFKENEVEENNNVQKIHVNNVKKPVPFYSLDVIISVGYRVKYLFGKEKDDSFKRSIGNIYQLFDGKDMYESLEEKSANLLYCITKNNSFHDANKRIAATVFL